ncbi:MAG TPA: hypothetical protein VMB51_05250 [Solirubrobacteraceae bacterium]|nr:hypothetical protein [Solirubrobacteraceae bacterium]
MSETMRRVDARELAALAREAAQMAAPAYAAVGWAWADGVPDEARIEQRLRDMIFDVEVEHTRSTGGLSVSRWVEDGDEHFSIALEIGRAPR